MDKFLTVLQSLIDILSIFLQIPQIFFSNISSWISIELQLKFVQIFILVYLKISLQISEVFLNFFDTQIIFLR